MTWWGWMVVGTLLLAAELFAVDAQFYLIFIGLGAIIVGLTGLVGVELPVWTQWLAFAVVSLVSMFTIRKQLYEKTRGRAVGYPTPGTGDRLKLDQEVAPGQSCRTRYRGTQWTAVNVGDDAIPSGAEATIDAIDGLNLKIRLVK